MSIACSSQLLRLFTPIRWLFLVSIMSAITAVSAIAQIDRAVLEGAVLDPSGAAIVGASVKILAVNTDPAGAKSVRLQITGYRPAPAVVVRSYGVASHGISRSRWSAGGVFGLAPSSLTELVLRPAGSR